MSKMKKIILPCIIIFITLTIANISLAETATVSATAVRIRESASTSANIITNVYQDDEVEILEENGEWYKVKVGEKVGFAKAEFFKKKKTETPSNATTQNTVSNENKPQNTNTQNQTETNPNAVPNEPVSHETQQEITVGQTITLPSTTKIRLIPNLSTTAKTEIAQGTSVTIEANLGNWYKITNQTVSGWVTKQKLTVISTPTTPEQPAEPTQPVVPDPEPTQNTTPAQNTVPEQPAEPPKEPEKPAEPEKKPAEPTSSNRTAVVIVETARVRKGASKNAGILDVLDEDDVVTITGEEGDFYKITSRIGSGYISKSLVKVKDVTSRSSTEERKTNETNEQMIQEISSSIAGDQIILFAKQYLGYPYVLGQSTPEKGFDCSGFTRYVFGHFGYTLGQVAADQTSLGDVVERANLQIGDLILFYNDGKSKIGHCGIYMGSGDFIHSANPRKGSGYG